MFIYSYYSSIYITIFTSLGRAKDMGGEKSHYSIPLIFHNFPVESYLSLGLKKLTKKMAFIL